MILDISGFDWNDFLKASFLLAVLRVIITIIVGVFVLKLVLYLLRAYITRSMTSQNKMIINRLVWYTGVFLIITIVLGEMGLSISTILGAAGIMGIVIGIASQTSLGNIISGLFLISEHSFAIGDTIKVGTTLGIVYSIDLLSIKIKTFDNLLVRIPNQTIIASEVTNLTRFQIRRADIIFKVAYNTDLDKLKELLDSIAENEPLCLTDPKPIYTLNNITPQGLEVRFGVWSIQDNFLQVKTQIMKSIIEQLYENAIEIPIIPAVDIAATK